VAVTHDKHSLTRVRPHNDVRHIARVPSPGVRDDLRRDPEGDRQRLDCGLGADELRGYDRLYTGFPSRNNKG
jgi:hypothetical protein